MPPQHRVKVEPYMPPPTGTSTLDDFKILSHVNLKVPKKSSKKEVKADMDSEYEEITKYEIMIPDPLAPAWIKLSPSSENFFIEVSNSLDEGLEVLQSFERWSKHPDMKIYMDALE